MTETLNDERNERILDATEALISSLGFDNVRLVDVGDAAGVSIGSLQHRFRSRDNLLRAAAIRADERERSRWLQLTQGVSDPWDRLLALLQNVLSLEEDKESSFFLQLVAASQRNPELQRILQTQQDRWVKAFQDVVADGVARGRMTSRLDPEEAGLALLALTDGFYLSRNIGDRPPDLERVLHIAEVVAHQVIDVHEPAGLQQRGGAHRTDRAGAGAAGEDGSRPPT